jgi:hypothetical protein
VSEPKCVTHFTGCACSEARWQRQLESVTRERDGLSKNLYVANLAAVQAAKERDTLKAALEDISCGDLEHGESHPLTRIARAALERMGERKGEG